MLEVALHETAKEKYLNYAYSVISSRALPDVRDGLKPVQRRILYAMFHNLALKPEGRYRKSAAVVGEVMAKYHPHGDSSIYEAMVRMAQPFSLLHPLVEGQGNFGSLDGDNAAAMRYTEAKLQPLALQLVEEIKKGTVEFRPNYDGQHPEPVVLPVRFPQLLVNGSEGIAVGMATRIPTHNLAEVLDACCYLLRHPTATNGDLVKIIRGPDFPTGGVVLNSPEEIQEIYTEGRGSILLQGVWEVEQKGKQAQIVVTEIPYGVNKALLVEKIGKLIEEKKIPLALDVRDESAEDVRIVIEIKKGSDAEPIMSYLFRYTPLQTVFPVNLTCLVPSRDAERALEPKRCDLLTILRAWLEFRYETVQRRFCHDLQKIQAKVHTLEGFEIIFSRMNEALGLIRNKAGKKVAGDALIKRFNLSPTQVEVILETPLYKLSSMEVQGVLDELQAARSEALAVGQRLGSPAALWGVIHKELQDLKKEFGKERQTEVGKELKKLAVFKGSDLIVSEKTVLYVTREGWVKRQGSFTGLDKAKLREGDSLGWVIKGNTKNTATFFTDAGGAYTIRLADIASGVGFGEPLQKHFTFVDGERVVGVVVNDGLEEVIAMSRWGRLLRFPLLAHKEPSIKNGRRFAKLETDGDKIVAVYPFKKDLLATALTAEGQALCFPLDETPIVQGAGKGVTGIKLNPSGTDRVLAFEASEKSELVAKTKSGKEETISAALLKRAHTGKPLKGGPFVDWLRKPYLPQDNENGV